MELAKLSQNPDLICALQQTELQQLVTEIAGSLRRASEILAVVAQRLSAEPARPSPVGQVSASAHYLPLKTIAKRIRDRGGDKKIDEEWVRDLVVRYKIPHRLDAQGEIVLRWRDFTVWEKRWWRNVDPEVKTLVEDVLNRLAEKAKKG